MNYRLVSVDESPEYLVHHGIKGQKWGVRRYQNKDGSLTNTGKKRYENDGDSKESRKKSNRDKVNKGKQYASELTKKDRKMLNKMYAKQRKKRIQAGVGAVAGMALMGLSISYLKDLGLI